MEGLHRRIPTLAKWASAIGADDELTAHLPFHSGAIPSNDQIYVIRSLQSSKSFNASFPNLKNSSPSHVMVRYVTA